MAQILTGTSGFSFRDWTGTVYPADLRRSEQLSWYAKHLPLVELNFSFYRMPSADTLESMRARVPDNFRFVIKAHRSLTHEVDRTWPSNLHELRESLAPLREAGMLVALLFQFPFRFRYTPANRSYLSDLCEACTDLHPAIELRHREWMQERVYEGMRARRVTLVCPDLPSLNDLPAFMPLATNSTAYLRLHGRNASQWWNGTNESRYHYRYSTEELRHFAHAATRLAHETDTVIIAFNNHFEGNAFHNAREFATLIDQSSEQ